jgi:hypothetical protein
MSAALDDAVRKLVERGDLEGLFRQTEALTAAGEWDALYELRDRCRAALARGKQLWPIASRIEYLLALRAPAAWAAPVVVDGAGLFAPGPLAEVVASTHTWAELAPHLTSGPLAAVVLHERVVRGEDLTIALADAGLEPYLDLPARLEPWEPDYAHATYTEKGATVAEPVLPALEDLTLGRGTSPVEDTIATDALRELVRPWAVDSNGHVEVVAVEGTALDAIAALRPGEVRGIELDGATALAYLAWTGASGGAHGRRRGGAAGRLNAWWTVAALAGIDDEWPLAGPDLLTARDELTWWRWEPHAARVGWRCHLAIEDSAEGLAWALAAVDRA